MSANAWFITAIIGFSLSAAALVVAVILFFKMRVLSIIGDLSGKTVAREIRAMRESNTKSGTKRHSPGRVNLERGVLTESVTGPSGKSAKLKTHTPKKPAVLSQQQYTPPQQQYTPPQQQYTPPQQQYTPPQQQYAPPQQQYAPPPAAYGSGVSEATEILTERLVTEETDSSAGTTVLDENLGTTVLGQTAQNADCTFEVTRSIIEIHTEEVIV